MESIKPHSADYFTEARDFWWNTDFLQLMAKRLHLNQVKSVLDVGSGQGHWGLLLLSLFHPNAKLIGIEPEKKWRQISKENANKFGFEKKVDFIEGEALHLPFEDNSFDLVTCQTVLIHLANPLPALLEMKRVLKPGGLLLASEPNNLPPSMFLDSINYHKSIAELTQLFQFQLTCIKGKETLGEGNLMLGDLLPELFAKTQLHHIQSYISDMADFYIPPYDDARQKAGITSFKEALLQKLFVWDKETTRRYYYAGGGDNATFIEYWKLIEKRMTEYLNAIDNNTYYSPGGNLHYLTSGRK